MFLHQDSYPRYSSGGGGGERGRTANRERYFLVLKKRGKCLFGVLKKKGNYFNDLAREGDRANNRAVLLASKIFLFAFSYFISYFF